MGKFYLQHTLFSGAKGLLGGQAVEAEGNGPECCASKHVYYSSGVTNILICNTITTLLGNKPAKSCLPSLLFPITS